MCTLSELQAIIAKEVTGQALLQLQYTCEHQETADIATKQIMTEACTVHVFCCASDYMTVNTKSLSKSDMTK